jgi:signal transduction histidine kinase
MLSSDTLTFQRGGAAPGRVVRPAGVAGRPSAPWGIPTAKMQAEPSIYPDFLRIGMGKLKRVGGDGGDLLGLLTALEHFHHDIRQHDTVPEILSITQLYLEGLGLFEVSAYYLVNPVDFDFELTACEPAGERERVEQIVQAEVSSGKFAWALRQGGPVFFPAKRPGSTARGLLHALVAPTQVVGLFCGILKEERVACQEVLLRLVSILLGTCSYALAGARSTADLKNKVLAANRDLQRTVQENAVLARIPAESPAPVLRLSRRGQVLYSNAAGQALLEKLGYRTGDFLSGSWLRVLDDAFASNTKQESEAVFGEQTFAFVGIAIHEADYANFYGTDITERKRAEAELRRAEETAQAANRAKSEFLGIVTHDLRNPLNGILAAAAAVREDLLDHPADALEMLGLIERSADHMLQLVKNLLDLNALEEGKVRLEPVPVRMGELVHRCLISHQPKARAKGQTFHFSQPPQPLTLTLDPNVTLQVVDNLVSNAVKYSPSGRNIYVRLTVPNGCVRLDVQDEGPGLTEADRQKLFGKFVRLSPRPTGDEGSTGLGLSIVKRLVEASGARVSCTSEVGRGTTFSVEWPRAEAVTAG